MRAPQISSHIGVIVKVKLIVHLEKMARSKAYKEIEIMRDEPHGRSLEDNAALV